MESKKFMKGEDHLEKHSFYLLQKQMLIKLLKKISSEWEVDILKYFCAIQKNILIISKIVSNSKAVIVKGDMDMVMVDKITQVAIIKDMGKVDMVKTNTNNNDMEVMEVIDMKNMEEDTTKEDIMKIDLMEDIQIGKMEMVLGIIVNLMIEDMRMILVMEKKSTIKLLIILTINMIKIEEGIIKEMNIIRDIRVMIIIHLNMVHNIPQLEGISKLKEQVQLLLNHLNSNLITIISTSIQTNLLDNNKLILHQLDNFKGINNNNNHINIIKIIQLILSNSINRELSHKLTLISKCMVNNFHQFNLEQLLLHIILAINLMKHMERKI